MTEKLRVTWIALEWPSLSRPCGGVGRYLYRLASVLADQCELSAITGPAPRPLDGMKLLPIAGEVDGRWRRYYDWPVAALRTFRDLDGEILHFHGDDWPLAFRSNRATATIRTYYGLSLMEAGSGRPLRRANHYVLHALDGVGAARLNIRIGIGPDSTSKFGCSHTIAPVVRTCSAACSASAHRKPNSGARRILFVGSFHGKKRGSLALQAVRYLRSIGHNIDFVVVGPASDKALFEREARFYSGVSDNDIHKLLLTADVLLVPSSYEGFGIPAWEAMLHGTPVVGTANPGFDFVSASGAHAMRVTDSEFPVAVHRLLTLEGHWRQLSSRGRSRAEDILNIYGPQRYLDLYRTLACTQHRFEE